MMKLSVTRICLVATIIMTIASCRPEAHKDLGAPRDIMSSLSGTWKLIRATQIDEDASKKGFPYREMDITTLFPFTDFVLELDLSGGAPSTFNTTPGNAPRIIKLASGNWTADNADYPQVLTLTNGVDIEKVMLGGYPSGPYNTLKLKVERKDASTGKLLITYNYEFAKQ